jgi:uncharacterized membrane protein HdeD (DUF308 family)
MDKYAKLEESLLHFSNWQSKLNQPDKGVLRDGQSIIEYMENNQKKLDKKLKGNRVLFIVSIAFYVLVFFVNQDPDLTLYARISAGGVTLSLLILLQLVRNRLRHPYTANYHIPVEEFMEEYKKRNKFWPGSKFQLAAILLGIDVGLTFSLSLYLQEYNLLESILIIQAFFIPIATLAILIAYRRWRKKDIKIQKLLYHEIDSTTAS